MEQIFTTMFSRKPDEIIHGDYFYRVPWIETEQKRFGTWTQSEENLAYLEERSKTNFRKKWENRTFDGDFIEGEDYSWLKDVKGKGRNPELYKIFTDIAASGIPIVDIASSESMGLIPYILKLNRNTPCLATDIDSYAMKRLRNRTNENLSDYRISIASFDNLDMPFADDAVPCITGFCSITSCSVNKNWVQDEETDTNIKTFQDFTESLQRKAISEVYRVLKPGGIFVIADGDDVEWEYDIHQINRFFENHNLLYGVFSRDMLLKRISEVEEGKKNSVPWDEKLKNTHFEILFSNRILEKLPINAAADIISNTGEPTAIYKTDIDEYIISINAVHYMYVLRKPQLRM